MTVEDIVKRHEFARAELRLVGYEEVGLPFYRIKLRAFTLEHKPIPAIEEFVLKCVHAGVDDPPDIGAFLGLHSNVVEGSLSNLVRTEDVHLAARDGRRQAWQLTSQGVHTLEDAEQITTQQGTFEVDYDGLLRKVVNYAREASYAPREAKEVGLLEVPAFPAKAPELHDLPHQDVGRVLAEAEAKFKRQLVSVVALERRSRLFRPAIALIYRSDVDGRVEVAFVLNGRVSPEHETAFAKANGPARLGMDQPPQSAEPTSFGVPKHIAERIPDPGKSQQLRRAVALAEAEMLTARDALNAAPVEGQSRLRNDLSIAETRLKRAQNDIDSLGATYLQVFDHAPRLEEALSQARTRLLIVSPWIGAAVVDGDFIRKLARLAQRGVKIHIGYGIGDDQQRPRGPRDVAAENELNRVASAISNLHVKRFGDTHAKILAYDSTWVICGSFNWLSFRGSREKGYRDEQSILLRSREMIDRKFAEILPRFDVR